MNRTDLAIEKVSPNFSNQLLKQYKEPICKPFGEKIFLNIKNDEESKESGLKKGKYITVFFDDLIKISDDEEIKKNITESLDIIMPEKREKVLVVGLGNRDITSDAVGPVVTKKILATRHLKKDFAEKIGLKGLKSVSVIIPDVLGNTGMEVLEIIKGIKEKTEPDVIIVIDALAAASYKRLFKTVQLTNTGISPGSGVKNKRKELSEKTLGIPVIAIGVPTVVDAVSLSKELAERKKVLQTDLIVTPKDADLLIKRISDIISSALNVFLQPEIDEDLLLSLV